LTPSLVKGTASMGRRMDIGSHRIRAIFKEQKLLLTPRVLLPTLGLVAFSLVMTSWSWHRAVGMEATLSAQASAAGTAIHLSRIILISGLLRALAIFALVWALMLARMLAVARRQLLVEAEEAKALLQLEGEQLQLAAKVFECCSESICITDAANRILRVNPAFLEMTGYTLEEVLGQDPRILSSHRQDQAFYEELWTTLLRTGRWQGEIWDRRRSGEVYPKWLTIDTVKGAAGEFVNFVAIASDISERIAAESNLRFTAEHDPLTGLPNRILLNDRFLQAKARAERKGLRVGMLFLDLDGFKQVNDTHGHALGDLLLQRIAGRLTQAVRASDTVTRLGGDEFIVMLPDLESEAEIMLIADKLLQAVREPYDLDGTILAMTFSAGGCCSPDHGTTLDGLARCADLAMYAAKKGGRNQTRYYAPALDGV
jgi:diguanylate cyclase (GGDEF)-like protein/PAS domain S-box-containing protein